MSTLVNPPFAGAAAVPPDPTPAFPRPFEWTADEFHRVNATGCWEGRRPFLIDGVIWEHGRTPPDGVAVSPRPLKWTVEEFDRIGGVWKERRLFLVRGVIWEQGPMNTPHASGVRRLNRVLTQHTPAGHCSQTQLPMQFGEDTEVFPDGAILPGGEDDYDHAHPTRALLVVEVSDTTLYFDRTTKAELYAAAGVPTYWVVNVDARVLHVFTDPQPLPPGGTAYRSHVERGEGDAVTGPDGRPVAVATLLPPAG